MPYVPIRRGAGSLFDENLNRMLKELYEMSQTGFGEVLTAKRTPIIELNGSYGPTLVRDVQTVSNSATITASSTGEILLSTGATASSTARLDSAKRIRYMPGFSVQIGIGIRIPTAPTGNQEAKWGVRSPDGNEGYYHGVDATGYYVAYIRGGSETKIRPSGFELNKLDGTGETKITLDLTRGNIFETEFTWYGYGPTIWSLAGLPTGAKSQKVVDAHIYQPNGATSIQTPNLPIFVEATNGGDAADFDVYVGGRQASIVGEYIPAFRTTSDYRAAITTGTTALPLVSFRNKTGFEDRGIQIDAAVSQVATNDHIIEFYLNPSLTSPSWGTPTNATAAETALEVDKSATALSGGTLIYSFFAEAGAPGRDAATTSNFDVDVPENQIITMAARTVTGSGTADCYLRMREEW